MPNNQQIAIEAYLERAAAIRSKIETLQQQADDHFGHDLEAIHWGHAKDLGRLNASLDEVLAFFDQPRW